MTDMAPIVLDTLREYLSREYLPRLRASLGPLSDADVWWRPTSESNSIGNLVLHIVGNARQWLVGGVGQRSNQRDRDAEFSAREGWTVTALDQLLVEAFAEFDEVLRTVPPTALLDRRQIQGDDVSVFEAVLHVVEHVSMHTGQVIQLAKWRAPGRIRFYEATNTGFTRLY